MTYRTAAEAASMIRRELKAAHGWNARQVSVRAREYSMGSSIDIVIKDRGVSFDVVKEVADRQERIERCPVTHEILNGGNRFVSVGFSRDLEASVADEFVARVEAALATVTDNTLSVVEGTNYMVGRPANYPGAISVWSRGDAGTFCRNAYEVRDAASFIGLQTLAGTR